MLYKKALFSLFFLTLSTFTVADTISEEEMKKALSEITQIKVLETQPPKVVSEVIVTEKSMKKKSTKKRSSKKAHKKKQPKKVEDDIDINTLPEAKVYGVVSTSQPFELKD